MLLSMSTKNYLLLICLKSAANGRGARGGRGSREWSPDSHHARPFRFQTSRRSTEREFLFPLWNRYQFVRKDFGYLCAETFYYLTYTCKLTQIKSYFYNL